MKSILRDVTVTEVCGMVNLVLGGVCYVSGFWFLGLCLQASGFALLQMGR